VTDYADIRRVPAGLNITGVAMTTVSGGACSVVVGDETVSVQVARDLTVAVGDVLLLTRLSSVWWAIARVFVAAPPPPDEPNDPGPVAKPTVTTGTLVCVPTYTGSFRDGKWRTDRTEVIQGRAPGSSYGNNTGGVFYGTRPRSLAGATVTRAWIRYRRLSGGVYGSQTSTLWLVTQASKPAGAPTRTSSANGPSLPVNTTDLVFDIPASWGQAMVNGTSGGLSIHQDDGSPYIVTAGRNQWSSAWTMGLDWRRG
jgi:hypothetical protein